MQLQNGSNNNLHAHACSERRHFSPKIGENHSWKYSRFDLWSDFLNDNIQGTISAFRWIKNMPINPKSVKFQQCNTKPHSTCFLPEYIKDKERNLCQDLLTIENIDSDLKVHVLYYANELLVRVRLSFQKLLQTRSKCRNKLRKKMFGKRVMTRTRCR